MTTKTTFHLRISRPALILARVRSWLAQRDPIRLIAPFALAILLLAAALVMARQLRAPEPPTIQPTPALPSDPLIIIRRESALTAAPLPAPTIDPAVAAELAALREKVAELEAAATAAAAPAVSAPAAVAPVVPVVPIERAPVLADPAHPGLVLPPVQSAEEQAADAAYRQQIGLTDARMDQALRDHQAQQLASCDAGRIANAAYCQAVREWIATH